MARNQGILEEGRERFEGALKDMERDWKRLQKRADQGRKQFEQQAQRQVKKIQTGLRKNPLVKRAEEQRKLLERRARKLGNELRNSTAVKRAESLRKDAETRFEEQLQSLLGLLRIAQRLRDRAARAQGRPARPQAPRARGGHAGAAKSQGRREPASRRGREVERGPAATPAAGPSFSPTARSPRLAARFACG